MSIATQQSKLKQGSKRDNFVLILEYTLLFGILTIGVFGVLIITHRSFIQYNDGYKQGYFNIVAYKNLFESIANGEGPSFWSWYIGPGMDERVNTFIDPFSMIAALFPYKYLELGYSVAGVLKLYFGGLTFILFGRTVKLNRFQCLIGGLSYAFVGWFVGMSLCQNILLYNVYLFPLLVFSVERIYQKKSPVPFVIIVAYYLMRNIYFAYMAAIVIVIYIILRYFAYCNTVNVREYARILCRFLLYGFIGAIISAVSSVSFFLTLNDAYRSSVTESKSLFFDQSYYEGLGITLIGRGMTDDYLDIGIPILIFLLLPIAIRFLTRKSTNLIITGILFMMMLMPFFWSMFNGFGYPTFRWFFTFIFFAVWCGVEQLDAKRLSHRGAWIFMAIGWIILAGCTYGISMMGIINLSDTFAFYILIQLATGIVLLVILFLSGKKGYFSFASRIIIVFALIISISLGWSANFNETQESFFRNNSINKELEKSTQRVGNNIEDDDFYRVDQVDGIKLHREMRAPVNENIRWKTRPLYTFNSYLPASLFEFNRLVGNNYGFSKRVYVLSNDNRMGIDFLYGVKYFLGNDEKNGRTKSDSYAGYGYTLDNIIDGVHVFKNKHSAGIGFVYDKVLSEKEFLKLSRLQREQALLQACVLPDDYADEYIGQKVSTEDLEFDIKDVPYNVIEQEGLSLEDNKISVKEENAYFIISVNDVEDSQLVVSFDNLLRDSKDGRQSASFGVKASNEKLRQMAVNMQTNQTIPNIRDYDLNMGYYDRYSGNIKITFTKAGEYAFDRFYISAMSTNNYEKFATICESNKMKIESLEDEFVKGSVKAKKDGILYLSIPVHGNWDIYIDGEKAKRIDNVDITFTGVQISAGVHQVELIYNNRAIKLGGVLSIIGVFMLIFVRIISRRRGRLDIDQIELYREH